MLSRLVQQHVRQNSRRWLTTTTTTTNTTASSQAFRPRRRPNSLYRPLKAPGPSAIAIASKGETTSEESGVNNKDKDKDKAVNFDDIDFDSMDNLERHFGSNMANILRERKRSQRLGGEISTEEYLQMADYMTAAPESLEEMQIERRALAMEAWDEEDHSEFVKELDRKIESLQYEQFELGDSEHEEESAKVLNVRDELMKKLENHRREADNAVDAIGEQIDPLQLVHGQWGESIIRVDRVQKVQRGGTLVRYRALVIGGNARGCAGFGIGKANSPQEATMAASRMCKRNIFFVDRHAGAGLVRDLAGRHNSCKVILLAVSPFYGLHGHPLICDLLLYFGIADCTAKSHGNRNQYNVIKATVKALCTHESLEEISKRRGKRLMNLERAHELQI